MAGTRNVHLKYVIQELKKTKAPLWKRVATDLEKPTRTRRAVNVSRINRNTKQNDIIVVPGKVLGSGELKHEVTIAAWSFSERAREQITDAKGNCISILDLAKKDPTGKKVRIIG